MKGFVRKDSFLSLCGLNCGLCSMHVDGYCPGCGGGEGNQSCKIAKCSLVHEKVEYCSQCSEFPCEKYEGIDEYDSFITHQNQMKDLAKAEKIGVEAYSTEQKEKAEFLKLLLSNYNDGRKKTFFCLAVNLLDIADLRTIMQQIKDVIEMSDLPLKEKSAKAAKFFQEIAEQRQITLKLKKKSLKK